MTPDKRKHRRVPLLATASLCDSLRCCESDVVNVSMGGLQIDRIPTSFMKDLPKKFTAIITYRDKTARVTLAPRWYKKDSSPFYTTVGFSVISGSSVWHSFIEGTTGMIHRDVVQEDVWGNYEYKYMNRHAH